MSNYVKLLNNLDKLKLVKIKENLDIYIELINQNKKDIVESLYELTDKELQEVLYSETPWKNAISWGIGSEILHEDIIKYYGENK